MRVLINIKAKTCMCNPSKDHCSDFVIPQAGAQFSLGSQFFLSASCSLNIFLSTSFHVQTTARTQRVQTPGPLPPDQAMRGPAVGQAGSCVLGTLAKSLQRGGIHGESAGVCTDLTLHGGCVVSLQGDL